ncbi:hypothetical protein [Acidithiobacillus thiooxidans]|uniref:Uncharacterized protein n=1 Tax=Acidithiobacillus thiooxidans ATCC 19377 TaxID=637390 RepID=A0A543Q257_ACITH|nr:hypothetical protein [Acidithiobacillus thiooxidans]MDX5935447.1 hypothetical protein [Acidithiobacillus thiooxidans]QFX96195.1 hypothetical protein GCD22_01924 [Acidithiobacillus thiooxidans ATCC 19377]TQN50414.1 hypothetical protein DLNHIDIE_00267 [Acidithiobacillus thiooxidans ATCC 19377]
MTKKYVVAYSPNEAVSNDECGYWSNEKGWTIIEEATRFQADEVNKLHLPEVTGSDAIWRELGLDYMTSDDRDPLTVAYITMGFVNTFEKLTNEQKDTLTSTSGQSELVSKIVCHSAFLDAIFYMGEPYFDGVLFYYEIAEPFGAEYTKALAQPENYDLGPNGMKNLAVKVLLSVCEKALSEECFAGILLPV